jgi:hypothetical protein
MHWQQRGLLWMVFFLLYVYAWIAMMMLVESELVIFVVLVAHLVVVAYVLWKTRGDDG